MSAIVLAFKRWFPWEEKVFTETSRSNLKNFDCELLKAIKILIAFVDLRKKFTTKANQHLYCEPRHSCFDVQIKNRLRLKIHMFAKFS